LWNDTDGGKTINWRGLSGAAFLTSYLTWIALGSNPGLRCEKMTANRSTRGTAFIKDQN